MLALEQSLQAGPRMVEGFAEIDRACDHILQLLNDATLLFHKGSWPTAAFLAITALEEAAKTHVGMFRRSSSNHKRERGNGPNCVLRLANPPCEYGVRLVRSPTEI